MRTIPCADQMAFPAQVATHPKNVFAGAPGTEPSGLATPVVHRILSLCRQQQIQGRNCRHYSCSEPWPPVWHVQAPTHVHSALQEPLAQSCPHPTLYLSPLHRPPLPRLPLLHPPQSPQPQSQPPVSRMQLHDRLLFMLQGFHLPHVCCTGNSHSPVERTVLCAWRTQPAYVFVYQSIYMRIAWRPHLPCAWRFQCHMSAWTLKCPCHLLQAAHARTLVVETPVSPQACVPLGSATPNIDGQGSCPDDFSGELACIPPYKTTLTACQQQWCCEGSACLHCLHQPVGDGNAYVDCSADAPCSAGEVCQYSSCFSGQAGKGKCFTLV